VSWTVPEADGVAAVLDLQPVAHEQLREVVRAAWLIADRRLLTACCARMAEQLGARLVPAPAPEEVEPTTPLQQAALDYADQFLLDANAAHAADGLSLPRLLTLPELANFVAALNALEAYLRACALLDLDADVLALRPPVGYAPAPVAADLGPPPPPEDGVGRRNYRMRLTDPDFRDIRASFGRTAVALSTVDEVTTEAVRLRNATFQQCLY
jgi:hypothetical protein